MKTIIFKSLEYQLLSLDVVSSRLSASIVRGEYDIDTLLSEVETSESITVKENGSIIGVYNGYTNLLALSVHTDSISVELINVDIQTQIDAISQTQTEQGEAISNLGDEVSALTPYEETQRAYYGETEKTFYNAPAGNVSVFFDNYNGPYSVSRVEDRLIVSFNRLDKETDVTISIQ